MIARGEACQPSKNFWQGTMLAIDFEPDLAGPGFLSVRVIVGSRPTTDKLSGSPSLRSCLVSLELAHASHDLILLRTPRDPLRLVDKRSTENRPPDIVARHPVMGRRLRRGAKLRAVVFFAH